MQTSISFAEA